LLDGLTVVRAAFARTVRLVATANKRPAVLRALVNDEDLEALSEIEGATSTRLVGEGRGLEGVDAREFVFGVPHAKFVNAAFAYSRPRTLNRFNGPGRGCWYAALEVQTSLAEVVFHMTDFLAQAGEFRAVVEYVEMHASLAGEFLDLRKTALHPALGRDRASAYAAGNALADAVRAEGHNGIIYPSVRHPGGTCFAALWPSAVQSVVQGGYWRAEWSGEPTPQVTPL
jgi:RES domain-containing protein